MDDQSGGLLTDNSNSSVNLTELQETPSKSSPKRQPLFDLSTNDVLSPNEV